jgi:hypothetical protein
MFRWWLNLFLQPVPVLAAGVLFVVGVRVAQQRDGISSGSTTET